MCVLEGPAHRCLQRALWIGSERLHAFDTLNVVDLPFRIDPLDEPTIETDVGSLMLTTWIGDLT